jgi:hypothetical protein
MASIQGIYVALFGRPADPAGLAYFNSVTKNGTDLSGIGNLAGQKEYTDRFSGQSNTQIINTIYQSLFGRDGETAGVAFWADKLATGALTINNIAIAILDGAQGADKTTVDAKIAAADLFTAHLDLPAEQNAYKGAANIAIAHTFLSGVDATHPGTAAAADAAILQIVNSAGQAPSDGGAPGGDGGPAPDAAAFDNHKLVIAAGVDATLTNNGDGTADVTASGHSTIKVTIGDLQSIEINANAKLNTDAANLDGHNYDVSGAGTLNATGVIFIEASKGATTSAGDDVKFDASLDLDPRNITSNFTVNGNQADAFKVAWDYVDYHYTYYNTSINEVGVKLGLAYFEYLKAGGQPLTDVIVKANDAGRVQSMHDNLLGNLDEASIRDKFLDSSLGGSNGGANGTANNALGLQLLNEIHAAGAGGRPIYDGAESNRVDGATYDTARGWDYDHGLARTDYVEKTSSGHVDLSATNSNGYLNFGGGNTADGFNIVRDAGAGIEIALKAKERGGADYLAHQENGVTVYHVDAGSDPSAANRAAWNFDFSVATGINGNGKALSDYTFKAFVDVDKSDAVNYVEFDLQNGLGSGNTPWLRIDGGVLAGGFADEDGTNPHFSQNSVNIGFSFLNGLIDNDPTAAGVQPYNFGGFWSKTTFRSW